MNAVTHYILTNPLLAIFLALGAGNLLGMVKIKKFSFGTTVGVLLVALLIGMLGPFKIDPLVKAIFFDLFVFTIGYEVGPSFIRSLKSNGIKLVIQAVFFAAVALTTGLVLFKVFQINLGEGAGIMAGAVTQSATVGTSAAAINGLDISRHLKETYLSQLTIGYALTYVFGAAGVLIFLKNIAPLILGINLKEETKKLAEKLQYRGNKEETFLTSKINLRVLKVSPDSAVAGQTIACIEANYKDTFIIEEVFRNQQALGEAPQLVIQPDDYLVVVGEIDEILRFLRHNPTITEVSSEHYRRIPLHNVTVMLTKHFSYAKLQKLAEHGIMIQEAQRDGQPLTDLTTLQPEDRLTVIGMPKAIKTVLPELGYEVVDGPKTDLSFLSLGVIVGTLLGSLVLHVGKVPLEIGAGGGALFAGLYLGWFQERHPKIGTIPGATRWFLKAIGLNLFIAIVGLESGAQFIPSLEKMGIGILLVGAVISIVPHFLSLLFGHYVLKLNPIENIGALCGAGTHNPAMSAISEETGSSLIALSYTPAFAVANILLTIMGPIVVALLS